MMLTSSVLSKASFFGSLLNRCRPSAAVAAAGFNSPSAGLKTIEEQVGLPPRPKKPLTPYFRYMRDIRSEVSAENPKASTMEVIRAISNKWKTVDPNVKQRLQNEFKKDLEVYVQKRAKYDAKITAEQRSELKKLKHEKIEARARRVLRRRMKDSGRPKRPASAFLIYIRDQRTAAPNPPTQKYRDWLKDCTSRWAAMSEADKEKFFKQSRLEIEEYKKNMNSWEEKMVRDGNVDLVRQQSAVTATESKQKKP